MRLPQVLRACIAALALVALPAPVWAESLADSLADAYRNSNLLEQNRALTAETVLRIGHDGRLISPYTGALVMGDGRSGRKVGSR